MGEEACSDRRATPQISTTDVFPNTPPPGRTNKYSWMLVCTVWWCLLEHILSAGFYYDKVHQGTNGFYGSFSGNSVSQLDYRDSGFTNGTVNMFKYITSSRGNRLNVQTFQKVPGGFEQTSFQNRAGSCGSSGKQYFSQTHALTGSR